MTEPLDEVPDEGPWAPDVIRLGAAEYRVSFRRDMDPLGRTKNAKTRIWLRPNQSPSSLRDTMLHEVLHALIWTSGASTVFGWNHEREEDIIRLLSPWLLGVIRDNPLLLQMLTESENDDRPLAPGP